jgi:hypothetical protein
MCRQPFVAGFFVSLCFSAAALAQETAPAQGREEIIYVQDLKAEVPAGDTSKGAQKVEKNAESLTQALIRELNARGVVAYRLKGEDPVPSSGWEVSGVFSETVPNGLPLTQLFSHASSAPNTEVKMNVVNLAAASDKPAAAITTPASLAGQESAVSFNPYLMAVKLVAHRVKSNQSIEDLAKRLATQILDERA